MAGKPQWTDEDVALLRERFDAGDSAQAIANRLGLSRGAVCGKLHRLGLSRGGGPRAARAPAPARRKDKPAPKPKAVLPPLREPRRVASPPWGGQGKAQKAEAAFPNE